jgi:hypothetical protein
MVIRLVSSVALASALVCGTSQVAAEPLPRLSASLLCVPSSGQESSATDQRPGHFCLLTLPALFDGTSLEIAPNAAIGKKRVGAEVELKF